MSMLTLFVYLNYIIGMLCCAALNALVIRKLCCAVWCCVALCCAVDRVQCGGWVICVGK